MLVANACKAIRQQRMDHLTVFFRARMHVLGSGCQSRMQVKGKQQALPHRVMVIIDKRKCMCHAMLLKNSSSVQ